jgi:uncharacterized protein YjbJ (UPF0337 family)
VGEESARLRDEIDRTRGDLTRDVNQIADKTSPSRIVGRRVERTRRGLTGLKERVMGSSHGPERYPATYGPTYTDDAYTGDVYGTGAAYTGEYGYSVGDSGTTDEGGSRWGTAKSPAQEAKDSARESVREHAGSVREHAEGNPLAAGVIAFGVGWLVSSLLPASEPETRTAQRATDVAREHGGPVVDQAKQAAQEIGENLQDRAQGAAQQVKDRAQDAAGTVREEAKQSASSS